MGKSSRIGLTGDKELEKALRSLGPKIAKKVLRQAVSAAATPVVKSAKANVTERSGLLKKSLGKKVRVNKNRGTASARVGARSNVQGEFEGKPHVPWRVAHLVELGHIAADGSHVPAKPFLRPAADENEHKAVEVMTDKLAAGIVKEAASG